MAKTEAELKANRAWAARQKAKDPEGFSQKMRDAQRRYYEKNAEKVRERHRTWYAANKETERMRRAEAYARDPEKMRDKSRRWREANPEAFKASAQRTNYKRLYNMSIEERDAKFAAQGFVCDACGTEKPGTVRGWGWAVDHDHATGKVRGIICLHCNVALGKVRDSTDHLRKLIAYLERHSVND